MLIAPFNFFSALLIYGCQLDTACTEYFQIGYQDVFRKISLTQLKNMSKSTPNTSRPAPKIATPVIDNGVRYQQDQEGSPGKEFGAAYLAAIDIQSGQLLWLIKIADAIHHPPGSPWEIDPVYFSHIEVMPQENSLIITTDYGKRYAVDLRTKQSKMVYDPADFIEPDERLQWKMPPPPPPKN